MPALDDEKRKLIVNEIEAWRRGKLLPEQYCDFLQNLYLDDLDERPKGIAANAVRRIGQASRKQWMLVFGIFALICVVVLHFSAFPLALQIGLVGLTTTGFVALGGKRREQAPLKGTAVLGAGMLFLAGTGAAVLKLHGWTEGWGPIVLLSICGVLWIGCGLALRVSLFHFSGWVALIVMYALLLNRHIIDPSWIEVQAFWLPASFLFGWLSWFAHGRVRSAGTALFAVAIVLWFMPEAALALNGADPQQIEIGFLIKVIAMGAGMYRLKKQWMEWVA
ncbi:hypothetical protein ACFPVX_20345 [Cohnella faecalis]|uniref:DUF2157 domain-containing protein n=1 Tax=Cohnella faecalis TaxID=2315694 RepID=A0A398CU38_9BACL|nr:hypothetical protein [Cohnella faecalis]RIE04218.1 hypothetical protein D3H35_06255 [Cohnella faecalis]